MRAFILASSLALLALFAVACGTSSTAADGGPGFDATVSPSPDAPPGPDAPSAQDGGSAIDANEATDGGLALGPALYATHCALCHGPDGEGYAADNAPAIYGPDFLRIATDAFIHSTIRDGRPGTPMSPWGVEHGGPLSPADVFELVALLRSFETEPFEDVSAIVISGDATAGAAVYARDCASCHGPAGEGVTAPTLDNPVFHDTASDGFIVRSIELGRRGTPMEAFAGRLSAQDIHDVAAFIRTLRRDPEPKWPIEDAPSVDELVLNPAAPTPSFTLIDDRYVPAADVHAAYVAGQRMVLLDARATSDWVIGHIPGAAPFPFYSVDSLAASLPDDGTWIVAYCACPHAASGAVVDQLRMRGFETTAVLDEGIYFWRDSGYPMARGRLPAP